VPAGGLSAASSITPGACGRDPTPSQVFTQSLFLPVIAREGYPIVALVAGLALLLALGAWQLEAWLWRGPLLAVAVGGLAFTLYFFRDPERTPPPEARDNGLVAPADGRVVEIVEEDDALYLDGPATRVSIFLSPLDVHVNRVPARGVIEYEQYRPGDYLVAWHPKASEKNERSELGLRHPSGTKVLFKQIAGAVARRIEYHIGEGDTVAAGQRFGIVKFGSRMDVLVPPHVELDLENGQHVRAGETVIGWLPSAGAPSAAESQADEPSVDAPATP
jgi:phosphatidylserine decarboxylase